MSNLVESIVSNELVTAKKIFETRMDEIRDQKLYEAKRCLAADISEGVGGLTSAQVQARKELGWKKASDVLPDPRDIQLPEPKKVKVVKKKKLREDSSSFRSSVEAEKKKLQKKHPSLISKMKKEKEKEKEKEQPRDASAMVSPEQPKTDTPSSKRSFGKMVKQNINTFSGRDKDTPFVTKDHEGQTGRVLRTVVKGLASMGNTGE